MNLILMNSDTPIMAFNEEWNSITVLNNQFLPYALRDYVISTKNTDSISEGISHISAVRDFLVSRTLNLSRENAKVILNVAALPQSLKTSEKLKIVLACRGLNMEDNYWIKKEGENITFDDVNLRKRTLSKASYDIAILGQHVSATRDELIPDLTAGGMFPKYWHRNKEKVELWKTDKLKGFNSECEVKASKLIRDAGGNCIEYWLESRDDRHFSVCDCMTNDRFSLVKATDVAYWCEHTDQDLRDIIKPFISDFSNMVVADYVVGNTDRHNENWGFIINNTSNQIAAIAPMYDLNQSLAIDILGHSEVLSELTYEPLGVQFKTAVAKFAPFANIDFSSVELPEQSLLRWNEVSPLIELEHNSDFDPGNDE